MFSWLFLRFNMKMAFCWRMTHTYVNHTNFVSTFSTKRASISTQRNRSYNVFQRLVEYSFILLLMMFKTLSDTYTARQLSSKTYWQGTTICSSGKCDTSFMGLSSVISSKHLANAITSHISSLASSVKGNSNEFYIK